MSGLGLGRNGGPDEAVWLVLLKSVILINELDTYSSEHSIVKIIIMVSFNIHLIQLI